MNDCKHQIRTGLYSEYALRLLRSFQTESCNIGYKFFVNSALYGILRPLPPYAKPFMPQDDLFHHVANGEICHVDVENYPGVYWTGYRYECYSNKRWLELVALQFRSLVISKLDNEAEWKRYNFDVSVKIGDNMYSVAELYFMFDFLYGHMKSTSIFKRRYPEIAAKIIGVPRDPVRTEFIQTAETKKREAYVEFYHEMKNCKLSDLNLASETSFDKEFAEKVKPIYEQFKKECEQKLEAMKEEFQKEVAKFEIPKQLLVSN